MSEADVEQWVRIGLARRAARRPRGWDVPDEEVVEELAGVGVPAEVAMHALRSLEARGELFRTETGWRARSRSGPSRHAAFERTMAMYRDD